MARADIDFEKELWYVTNELSDASANNHKNPNLALVSANNPLPTIWHTQIALYPFRKEDAEPYELGSSNYLKINFRTSLNDNN